MTLPRDADVEKLIWPDGTPPGCSAGTTVSMVTGRTIRWSRQHDEGCADLLFLSTSDQTVGCRVNNYEVREVLDRLRLADIAEVDARTPRQTSLRAFKVAAVH